MTKKLMIAGRDIVDIPTFYAEINRVSMADEGWAGRLVVRATVLGGGWSRQLDLTLGKPVTVADGRLTLVGATRVGGYPSSGANRCRIASHSILKADYDAL